MNRLLSAHQVFQHCAPVQNTAPPHFSENHGRLSLPSTYVANTLTRVTISAETLEQSPDLLPYCEGPLVVPRRSPCALSHGRTPPEMSSTAISSTRCLAWLYLAAQLKISRTNFKSGVAANVSHLNSPVFTSVAHNRHRIAELFGSFRVFNPF